MTSLNVSAGVCTNVRQRATPGSGVTAANLSGTGRGLSGLGNPTRSHGRSEGPIYDGPMSAVDWVKLELHLGNVRCDEPLRLPERMSITTLAVLRHERQPAPD